MKIKVLVADDHSITREGLVSMLRSHPDMEVVGEADNGRSAVMLAQKLKPDIVLMDVSMPDLNGIDATLKITSESKGVKVIGLSMHSDKRFVTGMIHAGASGYLLKECAFEEVIRAIQAVARNQAYLCPGVANVMIEELLAKESDREASNSRMLSNREREILQLIAEGMPTRQIAQNLNVSPKTIESHKRQIMEKTGIRSTAALTKYALKEGITTMDM